MERSSIGRSLHGDRISNLPCDLMDNILKYLPLRDAVRTSILSKGWRYKWATIPYLVFDATFKENLLEGYNIDSVIYQILVIHKGPIVKLTLSFAGFESCPGLNNWLRFLSSHPIEELTLEFSTWDTNPAVSHHLFSFDHLKYLYLSGCVLTPPPTFKGLGRLVKLHLEDVVIPPGGFKRFLSKCPMLEYVNMDKYFFGREVVDAPNLKSFFFRGALNSIYLKNASRLMEISITSNFGVHNDTISEPGENSSNMIKFLSQLSSVTSLKCNYGFLKFLARGGVPQKLATNLNHLIVLHDSTFICYISVDELSCVLCLIRSSPNLQSLEISALNIAGADHLEATQFLEAQQKDKIPLCRLENVKMSSFSSSIHSNCA